MTPPMAKKRRVSDESLEQEAKSDHSASKDEDEEGKGEPSPSHSSSSESSSEEEESEEESSPLSSPCSEDVVNVDFEFFDPKPDDFHGTKALLKTYLDDETWDINGFVELFLAQTTVGSVIKTSEEESPIGIISALNLARYKDCPCMKEVYKYLFKKANAGSGKQEARQIETFWTKKGRDVGLIISERLVNIPLELIPPLYDGLFEEILWATEDEPTRELRDAFNFRHYLLMTKVYEELPRNPSTSGNQKQEGNGEQKDNIIFIKPEDEIFLKLSSWSFTFPVKGETSATHETKNMRQLKLVLSIEAKQIPVFATLLKGLVH